MKISFVIPCYRSETMIGKVVEEIKEVTAEEDFETDTVEVKRGPSVKDIK